MEKQEALDIVEELEHYIQGLKFGIGIFLETPKGLQNDGIIGWRILVDTSFFKDGKFDEILDFIESHNKKWEFVTIAERYVLRIYTG